MKPAEVRQLTDQELTDKLNELETEVSNLRFQQATHQIENPNVIKAVKRDVARVKTIMRERDLGLNLTGKT
ncbi:MAG: 50S ribosomal protein L29, partial [Calditrichia bacterium]|nr:50S ribosomal protein L29 [Calditrichia bacterium]